MRGTCSWGCSISNAVGSKGPSDLLRRLTPPGTRTSGRSRLLEVVYLPPVNGERMSTTGKILSKSNPNGACIEKGTWTPLPNPVPATTNFVFTPLSEGSMTFHMTGCSGDPKLNGPGVAVAGGMASQIAKAVSPAVAPSFLYHLGDLA